jgi:hypothetical protein
MTHQLCARRTGVEKEDTMDKFWKTSVRGEANSQSATQRPEQRPGPATLSQKIVENSSSNASQDDAGRLSGSRLNSIANDTQSSVSTSPALDRIIPRNVLAESIAPFPETMSCSQTFDDAFHCQSFGGQFLNVYRYGGMRDCSEIWSDFWFCMRNRTRPGDEKRLIIKERYMQKDEKYRNGPSSEDVWKERNRKVERAFDWDPDEAGIFEHRQQKL